VSPKIREKNVRGQYFVPIAHVSTPSPHALNEKLARDLWDFTEKILEEKGWAGM
jgi:hypothetical protein